MLHSREFTNSPYLNEITTSYWQTWHIPVLILNWGAHFKFIHWMQPSVCVVFINKPRIDAFLNAFSAFYFIKLSFCVKIGTFIFRKVQNSPIYKFIKALQTQENGSVGACAGAGLTNCGLHNTASVFLKDWKKMS